MRVKDAENYVCGKSLAEKQNALPFTLQFACAFLNPLVVPLAFPRKHSFFAPAPTATIP
jgi:hypothetical protein